MFAQSPDLGRTWFNNWGQPIANLSAELSSDDQTSIFPTSAGITVFSIPKYGYVVTRIRRGRRSKPILCTDSHVWRGVAVWRNRGILNQEAQIVDDEDRIHVLNRENGTGYEQWY